MPQLARPAGPGVRHAHDAAAASVRILLVDHHTVMCEALAAAFGQHHDLHVVGQAGSIAEARPMLADVDVAVVDLQLPAGAGADLIEELRRESPAAQVLLLGSGASPWEVSDAVRCGAAAVVEKSVRLDVVVEGVRRLAAGEALLSDREVIEHLRDSGRRLERTHLDRLAVSRLTQRERDVLQVLADGLDSQASAERLGITVRTFRNHLTNIETKLGVHTQLQALIFAIRYRVVRVQEVGQPLGPP